MSRRQAMSTDRATTISETVPTRWTEVDDLFFRIVGDALSTTFLWGAGTLLASYDPDESPVETQRRNPSGVDLPNQRSLAGWTVDKHGRLRYDAA
jgi:hypothetical protein